VEEELEELHQTLVGRALVLQAAYSYYCAAKDQAYDGYVMSLLAYDELIEEMDYIDESHGWCKKRDIDLVFVSANVEDKDSSSDNKEKNQVNADKALMRFEFLQVLARLAINKYVKSGEVPDVSDAIEHLIHTNLLGMLPDDAKHDEDVFRRARLYKIPVADMLRKYQKPLRVLFDFYARSGSNDLANREKNTLLSQTEWTVMLHECGVIDHELTEREGRLCFIWSQTLVTDEVKRREKMIHLSFVDFLEALCRLCCFKALPTQQLLDKVGASTAAQYFEQVRNGLVDELDRLSPLDYREEEVSTAPLEPVVEMMITLLLDRLDSDGGLGGGGDGKITAIDLGTKGPSNAGAARGSSRGLLDSGNKKAALPSRR